MLSWNTLCWICRVISVDGWILNLTAVEKIVDAAVVLIM